MRKIIKSLALSAAIAALAVLSSPPAAESQDGGGGESLLDLVVVTASRASEQFREVTSSISVITEEEIESSSARDLSGLLSQNGVKVQRTNGGLSVIQLRGFGTDEHGGDLGSHVLLLLNGRRIGNGNAGLLGLANVERVEIIRGPAAVQYGAAAMGGVVNVITKKGVGLPFEARIASGGGSFDSFDFLAGLSGSYGAFDFSAGFRHERQGDYKTGGGRLYRNSGYEHDVFSLETGYTFQERHRVGLSVNYFGAPEIGSPGTLANSYPADAADKKNVSVALDYAGSVPDGSLSWAARYIYGEDRKKYSSPRTAGAKSSYRLKSNAWNVQATYSQGLVELTGGLDYLNYDNQSSPDAEANHSSVYRDVAPFLLGKLRLFGGKFVLSAGGRYDFFNSEIGDIGRSAKKRHFSPSVGVAYLPVDFLKFRAHFSNSFAMPTPNQYGINTFSYGTLYLGNPDLEPETSNSYEFGVDVMGEHASASFTYFSVKTKNFIALSPLRPGVSTYKNHDLAFRKGVELSGSVDIGGYLGGSFTLKPSVAITHFFTAKTRNSPSLPYSPITMIPQTTVSAGLYFSHPGTGWMANLSINRFGKQRYSASVTSYSYTVVDLVVQKRLFEVEGKGKLSARIDVNNFTNLDYRTTSSDYRMPGRSVHGGLVYEF
jgi:vitamin B12 transporter